MEILKTLGCFFVSVELKQPTSNPLEKSTLKFNPVLENGEILIL